VVRLLSFCGILLLAFVVAGMEASSLPPAQSQTTFKSSIDVVTIHAAVRDKRGRLVRGLTARDFQVLDDGQQRPILDLRADEEAPLSVAILFDVSGSMRVGSKIPLARTVFDSLAIGLRSGHDEAAVFTFDSSLHEKQSFTTNPVQARAALPSVDAFGATSLYDAAAATARHIADTAVTRRAIIILTDGIDTSSALTPSQVSGLASAIDVPVFVVAAVPSIDRRLALENTERSSWASTEADLRDLAEWTGGGLRVVSTVQEAVGAAVNLLEELRHQYVIAIEASDSPGWRRLEVRPADASLSVRVRSGYFGGDSMSQ
jgi:VWFA-related protein